MVIVIDGYCDSDQAYDPEQRKRTTYVFWLAEGIVYWIAQRQSLIALSTAAAQYVAACGASMEEMAEFNILQDILPPKYRISLRIGIDNKATYIITTDRTYSRRTRNIELRWHYVREQVQKSVFIYTKSKEQ